jgi:hypothetical protein
VIINSGDHAIPEGSHVFQLYFPMDNFTCSDISIILWLQNNLAGPDSGQSKHVWIFIGGHLERCQGWNFHMVNNEGGRATMSDHPTNGNDYPKLDYQASK